MVDKHAPTHDLIRIGNSMAIAADYAVPSWVELSLARTPWVVVRRDYIHADKMPVGVRGSIRSQRFPAWLAVADIAEQRSPEELWESGLVDHFTSHPAVAALIRVAPVLVHYGYQWGPAGSVGFELATAVPTATVSSDLDVILRQSCRLEPDEARALHATLVEAAAPVQIDAMLETPLGGVLLADLATAPNRVLVRTPNGPRFAADPWAVDNSMEEQS